LARELVKNN